MALKTRPIKGTVYTPDGKPAAGAKIQAKLNRFETDGGIVVPFHAETKADENGNYTINLWPNERGTGSSSYRVTVRSASPQDVSFNVVVPDGNGALSMDPLIDRPPYPPIDQAQEAIQKAQAAASTAVANAQVAENAASQTGTDASNAEAASLAAQQAASDAQNIATQFGDVQGAIDAATSAANSASSSASTATGAANTASDKALEAAQSAAEAGTAAQVKVDELKDDLADPSKGAAMVATQDGRSVQENLDDASYLSARPISAGYALWHPPALEPMRVDKPGWIFDGFSSTVAQAYDLWDQLLAAAPDYVTKTALGPDSSGQYDVVRYVFAPQRYEKTIIVCANCHGGEKQGQYALWFFLREVIRSWKENPQLGYIRNNVRLVVIPISNPWGYATSTRKNFNGVNLNRNFDYRWADYPLVDPSHEDYKGTAAFSEVEAQYLRDTLAQFPEAIACIDIHNFGSQGTQGNYPYYQPAEYADGSDIVDNVLASLKRPTDTVRIVRSYSPSLANYAASLGMYGGNPEFDPGYYGSLFDSLNNQESCRWFGNIILGFAYAPSSALRVQNLGPFAKYVWWSRGTTQITLGTSNAEIEEFHLNMDIPCSGYVKITGTINVLGTGPALVRIAPYFGQNGSRPYGYNDSPTQPFFRAAYHEAETQNLGWIRDADDRLCIPFVALFPVTRNGPEVLKAVVGMFASASASGVQVHRYRCMIEFTPCSLGDNRVEYYSPYGNEGQGAAGNTLRLPNK